MACAVTPHHASFSNEVPPVSAVPHSLVQLMAGIVEVPAALDRPISDVASDSRSVRPGAVFFAQNPNHAKYGGGELFIPQAIEAGAAAVVRHGATTALQIRPNTAGVRHPAASAGVVDIQVDDPIKTLARVADRWFGIDSRPLQLIGVTGTNGKSSVAHFVAQALTRSGITNRCGVLGTLGSGIWSASGETLQPQALTTPDLLSLRRRLAQLDKAEAQPLVLEVSSHALVQRRTEGLNFGVAVFTNLSRDHLDYHHTMARYFEAKRRLFDAHRVQAAVINIDDRYGRQLARELAAALPVYSFSTSADEHMTGIDNPQVAAGDALRPLPGRGEHLHGRVRYSGAEGLRLAVRIGAEKRMLHSRLLGRFNACNLMASLAVLRALRVASQTALEALSEVSPVAGRMQSFGGGAPQVIVDFAHTPQALMLVLCSLREWCSGQLWCVFGCGGERDRGKRALMGQAAGNHADHIVITDDNPRNEDGDAIVSAILGGLPKRHAAIIERDRRAAIRLAVIRAAHDDVVLIAGKGHERYQEYSRHKRYFCDAEAVDEALALRHSALRQ